MRKILSLLVVGGLSAGLVLVAAAPSGASVGAKTTPFCKAVKNFDASKLGNPTSESGARKSLKQLKKLQKAAEGNTKKAMKTIVAAYQKVADGESATKAFANTKVLKALTTFGVAATKCAVSSLPDITLPDVSLPKLG
jgi:hypothetical protein